MTALAKRAVRYGIAGVIATAIYFVAVMAFVEWMHVAPVIAVVLATMIVIVASYVINRAFVFDSNRPHASAFTRFIVASFASIGLNAGLMHVATGMLGWPYLAGAAITTVVVPPLNFVVNYFWTFRPSI